MRGPGIARQGYPLVFEGATVGVVTSGTMSPTAGGAIALAYVSAALAVPGTTLAAEVRGRPVPAEVVPTPFYRRARLAPPAAPVTEPDVATPVTEEPVVAAPAAAVAAAEPAAAPDAEHVPGEGES
jgi:hypothetical protein